MLAGLLLVLHLLTRHRRPRGGRDRSRPLWPAAVLTAGIPTVAVADLVALGAA